MSRISTESMAAVEAAEANRDPISDAPGAHVVGTGVGATGGGVAGAVIGAVAGPIGSAVGMVAGAIAGGLAGKSVAEELDPTFEDAYWMNNFRNQTYVEGDADFNIYRAAYRAGYEGRKQHPEKTFEEMEAQLRRDYEQSELEETLLWDKAKFAARDAWSRVDSFLPGNSDGTGR